MTWNNQHAEFFRLNPPESVSVEVYDWARDINGNPTARYSMFWNNGERGEAYKGGLFRSPRREQVGYRDKTSSAALWRLSELFPRTRWSISPAGITGSRAGGHATFEAVRDGVPLAMTRAWLRDRIADIRDNLESSADAERGEYEAARREAVEALDTLPNPPRYANPDYLQRAESLRSAWRDGYAEGSL